MDAATFSQIFKGLMANASASAGGADAYNPVEGNTPSSIDWRNKGAVNAIQNQGQCGM
jgi:hypothetical protein